jgi:hypothetical protein
MTRKAIARMHRRWTAMKRDRSWLIEGSRKWHWSEVLQVWRDEWPRRRRLAEMRGFAESK